MTASRTRGGIAGAPRAHLDVQALGIHRHREDSRARSQERAARPGIARFFHPHLISRVLLDPGDEVWMEEPGYLGARSALLGAGARVLAVPVDAEGLDVEMGARRAGDARLVYVTPSHQYPLGVPMRLPRRLALLQWASRARAWVIEDDYDSEFRYGARPVPCLQGLDVEAA